jgi:hypothetical protein
MVAQHSYERWIFACDIRMDGAVPAAQVAKRLLKHMWRSWGIRCRGFSIDQRMCALEEENRRLRQVIDARDKERAATAYPSAVEPARVRNEEQER